MSSGEVKRFPCPRHGADTWGKLIAPLILYLNAKWRRVPPPLYRQKISPFTRASLDILEKKEITLPQGFEPRPPARNLVAIWIFL
jgi:hypothetical protein